MAASHWWEGLVMWRLGANTRRKRMAGRDISRSGAAAANDDPTNGAGLPIQAVSARGSARSNAKAAVKDRVGRIRLGRRALGPACSPGMPNTLGLGIEREIAGHQSQHGAWRRLDFNVLMRRLAVRSTHLGLNTVHVRSQRRRSACHLAIAQHHARSDGCGGVIHGAGRRGRAGIRAERQLRIDQRTDQKAGDEPAQMTSDQHGDWCPGVGDWFRMRFTGYRSLRSPGHADRMSRAGQVFQPRKATGVTNHSQPSSTLTLIQRSKTIAKRPG